MGHTCVFTKKQPQRSKLFRANYSICSLGTKFLVLELYRLRNASPFYCLVKNHLGILSILYLPHKVFIGATLRFFFCKNLFFDVRQNGFFLKLVLFKAGDAVCNIFFNKGSRKRFALAAGAYCKVLYKTECTNFLVLQLPSGLEKKISTRCFGVLGRLSNLFHKKESIGSAGLASKLGRRPSVRGIAMNPVDHPHGGRTNTVKPEVSPWGWVTKFKH